MLFLAGRSLGTCWQSDCPETGSSSDPPSLATPLVLFIQAGMVRSLVSLLGPTETVLRGPARALAPPRLAAGLAWSSLPLAVCLGKHFIPASGIFPMHPKRPSVVLVQCRDGAGAHGLNTRRVQLMFPRRNSRHSAGNLQSSQSRLQALWRQQPLAQGGRWGGWGAKRRRD